MNEQLESGVSEPYLWQIVEQADQKGFVSLSRLRRRDGTKEHPQKV
jgi:hypothetical protein